MWRLIAMLAVVVAWVLGAPGWLLLAAGVALAASVVVWAVRASPSVPEDADADEAIYRSW